MKKPNYIIILTDDQGYGDLSCMGATDFKTPSLDRLAASGARFTNWYANSPVCSPSRASLLTGRYPHNAGICGILGGGRNTDGLSSQIPTLATALKNEGYKSGLFGKWHLGTTEQSRPESHGFDEFTGFMSGCLDYYSHTYYWCMGRGLNPSHDLWKNGEEYFDNGKYLTELITEQSVSFIRSHAQSNQPFFLMASYNAPHYPMHSPQKYLDRFPDLPWDRRIMAAMISAVDDGVGEMLNELERQGILENTCIFFQSDNGPSRESRNWTDGREDLYYGGSAGMLKGGKFSLFEGGIRVPAIMSWPGKIPPGQVIDCVGVGMDIFPTFLEACGADGSSYAVDGRSVLPMVCENAPSPHDSVFWEFNNQTAIRQGRWKLVLNGAIDESPVEDKVFLSDLEQDMGEGTNLAETHPEVVQQLESLMRATAQKRSLQL